MVNEITEIKGKGVPVFGDDIDTDRIIPARFLKEVTFDKMGDYLFLDARFNEDGSPKEHTLNEEKYKGANIMIVNKNFGCGSSREHAPQAIKRYGIDAIIGESFAEIFAGNCKSLGVPLVEANKDVIDELDRVVKEDPDMAIDIDLVNKQVSYKDKKVPIEISEKIRQSFLNGTWNDVALLAQNIEEVKQTANKLPYMNGFK
jgi:3-isopropylmalate/(R)-2-methylmalate dehydratase small subunit